MTGRKPFLAGNWKMYKNRAEAVETARALRDLVGDETERDVAVFPPLSALDPVVQALSGSPIRVGAQTCHFEAEGAFTGEVSAAMLADAGCGLVLVGHSERRQLFGETDETVRRKLEALPDMLSATSDLHERLINFAAIQEPTKEDVVEIAIQVNGRKTGNPFSGIVERGYISTIVNGYDPCGYVIENLLVELGEPIIFQRCLRKSGFSRTQSTGKSA